MKTTKIYLAGEDHILCLSIRAIKMLSDQYGDVENIAQHLEAENQGTALDQALFILSVLMDAGDRYAKKHNLANGQCYSAEEMMDMFDVSDISSIQQGIVEAINVSCAADVEVEPAKKAETTPGK